MATHRINYEHIVRFVAKWEENPVRPHELLMLLDAAEAVLRTKYPGRKITLQMVIAFSSVINTQVIFNPLG